MKARSTKKPTKKPNEKRCVNLYLSGEAQRMGEALRVPMNRPSLSNVVEVLIGERAKIEKVA